MKKVICPNCHEIYDVDEKKDVEDNGAIECKYCHQTFTLYEGCKGADNAYRQYSSKAYKDLYTLGHYNDACAEYEYCLRLKDNDLGSIAGIALSKIYSSSFDKLEYENIITLLEANDIVLNAENTFVYLSFISDALHSFNHFLNVSKTTLMVDDAFINKTYFEYYLTGLNQIEKVIKYFKDSFELLDVEEQKCYLEDNKDFETRFKKAEDDFKEKTNLTYKVGGVGQINVKDGKIKETIKGDVQVEAPTEVNLALVPVNKKAQKVRMVTIIAFIILIIAIIIFMVLFFVTKNYLFLGLEFIPVVLAVGVYFASKYFINKSY